MAEIVMLALKSDGCTVLPVIHPKKAAKTGLVLARFRTGSFEHLDAGIVLIVHMLVHFSALLSVPTAAALCQAAHKTPCVDIELIPTVAAAVPVTVSHAAFLAGRI